MLAKSIFGGCILALVVDAKTAVGRWVGLGFDWCGDVIGCCGGYLGLDLAFWVLGAVGVDADGGGGGYVVGVGETPDGNFYYGVEEVQGVLV